MTGGPVQDIEGLMPALTYSTRSYQIVFLTLETKISVSHGSMGGPDSISPSAYTPRSSNLEMNNHGILLYRRREIYKLIECLDN